MTAAAPRYVNYPGWPATWVLVLLYLVASAGSPVAAADFDFRAPSSAGDSNLDGVMRDLAERILPVYQEADPERYLNNVSALQVVAGSYVAAVESRRLLLERRRSEYGAAPSRAAVYDLYARAKSAEGLDRSTFDASFDKAFHEFVPKLDDSSAYTILRWLGASPAGYRTALQSALDRQRQKTSINDSDAIKLVWTYLSFRVYRDIAPLIGGLAAEDDRRRYLFDAEVLLKGPNGTALAVTVVRPRTGDPARPALLEYTLGGSADYAKECASRGYAGVTALVRGAGGPTRFVPYESDGKAASTVVNWIAAQSWSDGRVGMYGTGYSGFAAWAAAKYRPAALKAIATIAPTAPGVDFPMRDSIYHNSAFRWSLGLNDPAVDMGSMLDEATSADPRWKSLDETWYRSGKAYRELGLIFGAPNPVFIRWLNHPSYDRYWQKMIPFKKQFAALDIPALTITGYYAASEPGALYYFNEHTRYNPRADHTLLIGPYDDSQLQGNVTGATGLKIDPVADLDLRDLRYRWFNAIFEGTARPAIVKGGRVNIEIDGTDQWTNAPNLYAIANASRRFYLAAEHEYGIHRLSSNRSASIGSTTQILDLKDRGDAGWRPTGKVMTTVPETHNGLVFVSEPLTLPTDIAGPLSGDLDFKVNKMDLDFTITLYERTKDGEYIALTNPGYGFRASYVHDRSHRRLIQQGVRQRIHFMGDRLLGRRLSAGSRLAMVLALTKRADQEINYGSGKDVSTESIADAASPIRMQWFNDSHIEIPIHR